MDKPMLLVIAGCNGSGKSSFSDFLTPKNLVPFDYDKYFLKNYNSLMDSELRDRMAHNITREFLDNSVQHAISKRKDFCYETNFNSTPMFWPNKFEQAGYEINCLDASIRGIWRKKVISMKTIRFQTFLQNTRQASFRFVLSKTTIMMMLKRGGPGETHN